MTTTTEIPREAWRSYFEELTTVLGTVEATVEVIGRDIGDQFVAERFVLTDMTYDAGDAIVVGLDAPGPPLEVTYDIEDGEGHQWLIRLERPPALPGE